jgi:cobalt/nickel transport protein
MEKKKRNFTVPILIVLAIAIMFFPLFFLQGAEFEGSDGAGSDMVDEVTGGEFVPWFEPIMERAIGGELPGEMESFFFCIQTGIGVGIIAFCFGWLAARRKYSADPADRGENPKEKVS